MAINRCDIPADGRPHAKTETVKMADRTSQIVGNCYDYYGMALFEGRSGQVHPAYLPDVLSTVRIAGKNLFTPNLG